jgi:hypothetical protein
LHHCAKQLLFIRVGDWWHLEPTCDSVGAVNFRLLKEAEQFNPLIKGPVSNRVHAHPLLAETARVVPFTIGTGRSLLQKTAKAVSRHVIMSRLHVG